MSIDLFQFGVLLRDLRNGCSLASNTLIDASAPSDLVDPICKAYELLSEACDYYLKSLQVVCQSDFDKECKLSKSDKIDSADNGHD